MKTSLLALLAVIGSASAEIAMPSLTVSVKDGSFADLGGLEPTLKWSTAGKAGDLDIEYGLEADARPTSDIASLPKNIWGKASGDIGAWGVTARAEFQGTDFTSADVDIDASNDEGLSLHVDASAGGGDGFVVGKVEASQSFDSDGADVTVNPRYDVSSGEADVVVSYSKDDTSIEITASQDEQSITVSKQVDDDNRIAPTLASNGDFSVEWERNLGNDNSLTATVTPSESLDLEWKDSSWTANINMPLEGATVAGANVSIKREVNF